MQKTKAAWRGWSDDEKQLFESLYKKHKRNFKLYVPHFENRTQSQLKSFYYNEISKGKKKQSYVENTNAT